MHVKAVIRSHAIPLLVLALALHAASLWIGYDRLPLLPVVGDGPLIQDAPLAFSRGLGMVAPSFEGTLGFGELYAHHPPVYLFVQGLVFRLFGLSPLSLRGVSLLATTLYVALFLVCFVRLRRAGLIDTRTGFLIAMLLLVEPMTWYQARWERMDSLMMAFFALSFLLLICAADPLYSNRRKVSLISIGAAAAGFGLSTHVQGVVPFAFLGLFALGLWRRIGPRNVIVFGIVPPLVFATLWFLAHGRASFEAIQQLRSIASEHRGGTIGILRHLNGSILEPRNLLPLAPIAFGVTATAWAIGLVRCYFCWRGSDCTATKATREQEGWIAAFMLALTGSFAALMVVAGESPRRYLTIVPLALAAAGVFLNGVGPSLRRAGRMVLILLIGASSLILVAYLAHVRAEWRQRSPDRFDASLASIPRDARIATAPDLWYALSKRGQSAHIIDYGFAPSRAFWESHLQTLDKYEYVILPEKHELARALGKRQVVASMKSNGCVFLVYH